MIFGLIPIGGKGTRLSLPYSKEMLPQKNYDHYNPVVNHLVEKMLLAGADKIVFVHGSEYKQDVLDFFNDKKYFHIRQTRLGFATVLRDFLNEVVTNDGDKIIFGLPDSVFDMNPFVEMLNKPGIVCGLFTTEPFSKVDRIFENTFRVKTNKSETNSDYFWSILKFDVENLIAMHRVNIFDDHTEIGEILNRYPKSFVQGNRYLDLGTWAGYNKYLSSNELFNNVEIEKKYDASLINEEDFCEFLLKFTDNYNKITSTDYYFTVDNPNVEFVRYRENSNDNGAIPDITIKNTNSGRINRFELTIPLSKEATSHNVMHFMALMGASFTFEVTKHCDIFTFDKCSVVMYSFTVNSKTIKVIEIELSDGDYNVLAGMEQMLAALPGFDPNKIINRSKYIK